MKFIFSKKKITRFQISKTEFPLEKHSTHSPFTFALSLEMATYFLQKKSNPTKKPRFAVVPQMKLAFFERKRKHFHTLSLRQ